MKNYFFKIVLLIPLLWGCGEKTEVLPEIRSHYTSEYPDKEIDLAKKLDEKIVLLDKGRKDTTRLTILYNKLNKTNTIIMESSNDTVFDGKIYKYKGLHYFCQKIKDSTYWISAAKIKRDRIQGLGTEFVQMMMIDELLDYTDTSSMQELIDKNKPQYALTPDKKTMAKFYDRLVDSLPILYRIYPENHSYKVKEEYDEPISKHDTTRREGIMIHRYFPNPVSDILTIETTKESEYDIKIYSEQQRLVFSESFSGIRTSLSLGHLQMGMYFLQLTSNELKQVETVKVSVI